MAGCVRFTIGVYNTQTFTYMKYALCMCLK